MRLDALSLRGVLRFTDPVTLDLASLPAGLVAVVGQNGEGKTTLVEAGPAVLYREWPSRGGRELVDYATTRDAYLEAVFTVAGRGRYRARVNLDAQRRAADAVLEHTAPDGTVRLLNDGKLTTYDAAVAAVFPPRDVLLASAVAAQNRAGSFITLDRRGRKELFQTLLGLDRYEAMADTARKASTLVDRSLDHLRGRRAVLETDAPVALGADLEAQVADVARLAAQRRRDVGEVTGQRDAAVRTVADLTEAATTHRTATARLRDLAAEAAGLAARRGANGRQRESALAGAAHERQVLQGALQAQRDDTAARIANNQALLDEADRIREAVTQLQARQADLDALRPRLEALRASARDRQRRLDAGQRRLHEAQRAAENLSRAERAAGLVETVPCGGREAFATCAFLADALAARATVPTLREAAGDVDAAQAALQALADEGRQALEASDALLRQSVELETAAAGLRERAQQAARLEAAESRVEELRRGVAEAEQRTAALLTAVDGREQQTLASIAADATAIQADLDRVAAETAAQDALAQRTAAAATSLEAATARVSALDASWQRVTGELARLEATHQALEQQHATWTRRRETIARLDETIAELDDTKREWDVLARAFGRDGLPVLEIDAAGPTVSAFTNDLLSVCFGPRFTVELITQAAKADGKGTKEVFELRVLDNLRGGAARDLTDLSGGEQILVDEALKNALALFINARHAGAIETCWRDETTGPLDPENAIRYLEMLRRVQQIGRFRHILFVSHNPAAAALADVQVRLANGQAAIVRPPFTEAA